jgi:hypothetical protein
VRVAIAAVAVLVVVAVPGASLAVQRASAILEVRVGSVDAAVTLDPVGRLVDPNCPRNTCKFWYDLGTTVTLTPVSTPNSSFVEWAGGCSGSGATCRVTVNNNRYVRASFSRLTFQYADMIGGHIELDIGGKSCGSGCVIYPLGTTNVGVNAVVDNKDFLFWKWGGDCAGVNSEGCVFTSPMRWNRVVYAYFKRKDGLGTIQQPGVGTSKAYMRVTGSGTVEGEHVRCTSGECRIDPLKGALVAVTATPATGWRLSAWSGRCSGSGTTCMFSNQAPKYYPWVRATFVPR